MSIDRYCDADEGARLDAASFTLEDLIAPLGRDDFFSTYFGQKPFLIEKSSGDFFADCLSLGEIDGLFSSHPSRLRMAKTDEEIPSSLRPPPKKGGKSLLDDLENFSQGHTLIFDKANEPLPRLKSLCARLAKEMGFPFRINLYLTPAKFQGFSPCNAKDRNNGMWKKNGDWCPSWETASPGRSVS